MNFTELSKLYDFTGRTVVITGGSGVLGSEMARTLLRCGANLALLARNPQKAEKLFANELGNPEKILIIKGDVLDKISLADASERVLAKFGTIDCLLNGAGGNNPRATTGVERSFFDVPPEAFGQVL